jgi:ADP-ribose pyrophosphatase YjhB (NUDIX family)
LLVHREHVLTCEGRHSVYGGLFYLLVGGGVEFGEHADEAVVREFREEIGRDVVVERLLDVVENIFTVGGKVGHEVVFIYAVTFAPGHEPRDLEAIDARESDNSRFLARWLPIHEVAAGAFRIYPDGLPDRLSGWSAGGLLEPAVAR